MVYDVEGLGMKHLWKPAIETYGEVQLHTHTHSMCTHTVTKQTQPVSVSHQILQMFEDNYPEGLKRLFVIKGDCCALCFQGFILLYIINTDIYLSICLSCST